MIHTVRDFGIINKTDVDVFMELSCLFDDPVDAGNLISGSSAFSKSSLNIWKFTIHILLKPGLENFEHYFASVCDVCNCVVVWTFFDVAFLWNWNENTFSSPVAHAGERGATDIKWVENSDAAQCFTVSRMVPP